MTIAASHGVAHAIYAEIVLSFFAFYLFSVNLNLQIVVAASVYNHPYMVIGQSLRGYDVRDVNILILHFLFVEHRSRNESCRFARVYRYIAIAVRSFCAVNKR